MISGTGEMVMAAIFRGRLLASTFLIGGVLIAAPVVAQSTNNTPTTPPAGTTDPTTGERATSDVGDVAPEQDIVVTGSRIASPALISASPLQIIDAQDIDNSGTPNLQSVLLQNPAFGTPGISRTNSNFSTSSAGVATVDLRNLGSDRTLVLVDGRRFVAGIPGSATVDLNVIPAQFIERVDVLTGGASAIYGSDAVAGVVNIIYKKNFQGVELGGQFGISQEGDSAEKQANLTIGGNFGDDRGNVIAYVGYTKEGAVFSRDRERSAIDQSSTGALTGNPNQIFDITRPYYSSFSPQGRIFVGSTSFTYNADGTLRQGVDTNGANGPATGYNRSGVRTIAIPTERYLFATRANFEISKAANIFLEGTYASTSVVTELEPFPLDSAGANGIFPASGGQFAIENFQTNPVTGAQVLTRNPLVPLAIFNAATDRNGDGLRDANFTRRLSDFGNRGSTADRDTFRIVAGVDGDITDKFKYEAYYTYGQTKESQFSGGQVNVLNFRNALDVVTDIYDLNGNGLTNDAICRDANARAQGCVPANVFGGVGSISQGAVDYIQAPSQLTSLTTQSVAGGNISGSLFNLPAGPLGISIGTEYRREAARQTFDALTNAGLNGGNRLANTEGKFDVIEGYGEVRVPLLADTPFFQELTATGAGRVSKYSTVGTTYSYNGALEWAPIQDIRFRGVYARSVRAPNIGELFGGAGQDFPTGILDPCVGVTATTSGTLGTQCRANPGVAANIAQNGSFTINQADVQGVSGLNTSNPNLGVEKGTSYTLGAVINPKSIHFLRNFSFTADYFNIEIADAIVAVPRNFILQQCYQQANAGLCQFITRRPTAAGANSAGSLDFVNATSNNSGGLKTTGLDLTASYRQDLASIGLPGKINLNIAWTHVFKGYVIPLPGEARDNFNNEVGASRNKVFGTFSYDVDNVGITFRGNYIGPAFLDDQFLTQFYDPALPQNADNDDTNDIPLSPTDKRGRIKSTFYLDSQVRFNAGDNFEFYVGANNLLNTAPPPILSNLPGNTTGAETDAGTYDAIGRRFYAGARIKF
jgi:outer membrane receptor protein involved in Fe transport